MPPRIPINIALRSRCLHSKPTLRSILATPPTSTSTTTKTTPSSIPQTRHASILASISDNEGAYSKRIRRGRGPASGKGKTAGRGHKGQKQHGKVPAGFEGGQTPLHIVHGVRGFTNNFALDYAIVPLSRVQSWVAQGRIDPSKPVTPRELLRSRCVHKLADGIKLLASSTSHANSIDEVPAAVRAQKLDIVVSRASASAIAEVEKVGGSVTTRYYTRWALKQIVKGKMDPMISLQSAPSKAFHVPESAAVEGEEARDVPETPAAPLLEDALPRKEHTYRLPDATSRKAIEYYRDSARRGYLSHTVEEGKGPSLFFRTPEEDKARLRALVGRGKRAGKKSTKENLMW